jgi:serine/threonine protein kinase
MVKPGQRIGEYVLVDRIGQGAFGEVWRARHNAWSDQIVAIKIPNDPQFVRNLQREGIAVHRLNHPNIVKAINFDPFGDPPYLVMEYVPGWSLRQFMERGPMAIDCAVAVMSQIASALQYAHEQGLIHRDIKPENILVHQDVEKLGFAPGTVKLTDFGLGKASILSERSIIFSEDTKEAKQIVGSRQYMAPEQLDGQEVDRRADLYSCGVVLFEMLTGHRPVGTETPSDLNPAVPKSLDEIYRTACARLVRRFSSAEQLHEALARAAAVIPAIVNKGAGMPSPKTPPARPPPLPTGASSGQLQAPIGWAVVGTYSASDWHSTRVLLTKRDIIARMGNSVDKTGHTIEMLVPASQEAYVRSLLAGAIDTAPEVEQRTGGFPVLVANASSADSPLPLANPIRPLPVVPVPVLPPPIRPRLSRQQIRTYNIILVLCVLALIFLALLMTVPFFLPD